MGRLISIPNSDLVGTLQALDGEGVTAEHFEGLRTDPTYRAAVVKILLGKKMDWLDLSVRNAARFLRDFCDIGTVLGATPNFEPKGHVAIPCAKELTHEYLAMLIEERGVPRCGWTINNLRRVDAKLDCRKAEDGDYLLFTPASVEATDACPDFVGVSYRQLWGDKSKLTCREAVILWLFVWWASNGKIVLDIKGGTRTSSRRVGRGGVCVNGGFGELDIGWDDPDRNDPDGSARSAVLPPPS